MAQYVVPDPNDVFFCPFDETHTIRALGALKHLLKCAKSHPNMKMSICPFNQIHWVKQDEFAHHVKICPDKARYQVIREQEGYLELPNDFPDQLEDEHAFEEGEDWTSEMDSYKHEGFCWNTHVASSASWTQPDAEPAMAPPVIPKEMPVRRANASFRLSPPFPSIIAIDSASAVLQMNIGRGTPTAVHHSQESLPPGPPQPPALGIGRGMNRRIPDEYLQAAKRGCSRRMAATISVFTP